MSTLVRQAPCPDLGSMGGQLRAAFETTRDALAAEDSVVIVVRSSDLLGQGTLEDAAVASGLLGLMRAVTFEGGAKGWCVNVVATATGEDPSPEILAALSLPGVTGQVLNLNTAAIGKVVP